MLIDLSVPINEDLPVYPGDPKVSVKPAGRLAQDGYNDIVLTMGNHNGTHIDAPAHMVEDGKALDEYPVSRFVGRGLLLKSMELDDLKLASIHAGDIVIFATGMESKYHEPAYFEDYPILSQESAQYLVDQKVSMVGLDTGNVDIAEDFPIHKLLLAGDVLIIENLTNLQALKGKSFRVIGLPIKLEADGAPARVIAEVIE